MPGIGSSAPAIAEPRRPRRPSWAPPARLSLPRLGVVSASVVAGVVLVVAAGVFALLAGDRFQGSSAPGVSPTPVGSLPIGSLPPSSALEAFRALASDPARTYHVAAHTVVVVGDTTVEVVTALDHARGAYAGTVEFTTPARTTHEDVIVIPPAAYLRETDGPWRTGDAPKRDPDPFAALGPGTPIVDLGFETVKGRSLHHLVVRLIPVDTTLAPKVKAVVFTSTVFDLWVDEVGVPVAGRFELAARAVADEAPVGVRISADLDFSRVGEPMTISAPPE